MTTSVREINYSFPKKFLLDFFKDYYHKMEDYKSPDYFKELNNITGVIDGFKVDTHNYFNEDLIKIGNDFCKHFNINDLFSPHYLVVEPNITVPWHVDGLEAKFSINCLLSDNNTSVEFEEGSYFYNTAMLNVRKKHRVINGANKRIIFRLSFVGNLTYEDAEKIIFKTTQ